MTPEEIEKLKQDAATAAIVAFKAEQSRSAGSLTREERRALEAIEQARGNRDGFAPFVASRKRKSKVKGAGLGAYAIAWLRAGGAVRGGGGPDAGKLIADLKSFGHGDLSRGVQESVAATGGLLIPQEYAADLIEGLYAAPVLLQLGARVQPFKASMQIGRVDAGPTPYWIGEGQSITKSTPQTGAIVLNPKKLAILCDVSNDILRNPAAGYSDVQLTSDMTSAAAAEVDKQGMNGSGTQATPRGIISQIDTSQNFAKAGINAEAYDADVNKLVRVVDVTNRPREKRGFLMHPALEATLLGVRHLDGDYVFRREMLERQTLRGFPYRISTSCPSTHLIHGEFADLVFGLDTDLELAASDNERFSYDETSFRLIMRIDWVLRRSKSFAAINNY